MSKDTNVSRISNVRLEEGDKEMLKSIVPALKLARVNFDEIVAQFKKRETFLNNTVGIVANVIPGFSGSVDEIVALEKIIGSNESVPTVKAESKPSIKENANDGEKKLTMREKVLAMLAKEELSVEQACERLGKKNYSDYSSTFGDYFKDPSNNLGRRRKQVHKARIYFFATRSYYEANNIVAAYPGDEDVYIQE